MLEMWATRGPCYVSIEPPLHWDALALSYQRATEWSTGNHLPLDSSPVATAGELKIAVKQPISATNSFQNTMISSA